MATTLVLKIVIFVPWLRRLLFHTLLSLLRAALAFPIRALMSPAAPPCLSTLAPRYTKLSTSSTFLSLIVNGSSLPRLYLNTLVLSILIFKPTFPPNWLSLLNLSCAWLHLLDKSAKSSAKSRSSRVVVSFHLIPFLLFSRFNFCRLLFFIWRKWKLLLRPLTRYRHDTDEKTAPWWFYWSVTQHHSWKYIFWDKRQRINMCPKTLSADHKIFQ